MEEGKTIEGNAFQRAIADGRAEVAKPECSPQGAIDGILRIALDTCLVHPVHAEQAAAFVSEFVKAAVQALKELHYSDLEQAKTHFFHQMRYSGLSTAPLPDDPSSVETVIAWLHPHGWSAAEIECARQQIRADGGAITAATFKCVTINGRVHSRERLRLWAKPKYAADNPWFDEAAWLGQWPEIKPPVAENPGQRVDDDDVLGALDGATTRSSAGRSEECDDDKDRHRPSNQYSHGAADSFDRTSNGVWRLHLSENRGRNVAWLCM